MASLTGKMQIYQWVQWISFSQDKHWGSTAQKPDSTRPLCVTDISDIIIGFPKDKPAKSAGPYCAFWTRAIHEISGNNLSNSQVWNELTDPRCVASSLIYWWYNLFISKWPQCSACYFCDDSGIHRADFLDEGKTWGLQRPKTIEWLKMLDDLKADCRYCTPSKQTELEWLNPFSHSSGPIVSHIWDEQAPANITSARLQDSQF